MGRTITGTLTTGVTLTADSDNPVLVTGTIDTTANPSYHYALLGAGTAVWTITNLGKLSSAETSGGAGVQLNHGGTLVNGSTTATSALISGGGAAGVFFYSNASDSVVNFGTITGLGNAATGVLLWGGGGTVRNGATNVTTALIAAPHNGVAMSGAAGTLINQGKIQGTGSTGYLSYGAYFGAGGTVTNGSPTNTAALISGQNVGVAVAGGFGSIVNDGVISGMGSSSSPRTGVTLRAGGNITNGSTTHSAATILGGDAGIVITGGSTTITNRGTVAAASYGINVPSDTGQITNIGTVLSYGRGVRLAAGTVINGDATTPGARISAGNYAVAVGSGTVINRGTIIAGSEFGASVSNITGVYLGSGGTIINGDSTATGALITSARYGIRVWGGSTTVTNFGTIIGGPTVGTLSNVTGVYLSGGGSITNGSATVQSARIVGARYGVRALQNPLNIVNFGTIASYTGTAIYLGHGGTVVNAGSVAGASGSSSVRWIAGATGRLIIDPGAHFSGLVDGGNAVGAAFQTTLELAPGPVGGILYNVGSDFIHFGSIIFDAGADWFLSGNTAGLAAGEMISGFDPGDTLEITSVSATIKNYDTITHILTLHNSNNNQDLFLNFLGSYAPNAFIATQNGANTDITTLCFLRGTRIATPNGTVPVEMLAEGDRVLTYSGEAKPIVWVGTGKVLTTRGQRTAATPVIVQRDALAHGVPDRDLRVTKAHSLYLDGVLIPVEFLVNHRTIRWDDHAQEVEIYHIELEQHDVLIANGAPAESYRDDGNRWLFRNANSGWHLPPKPACAPVLTGGPLVDAAWRRLLDRAGPRPGLPLTEDPDLHLIVDGVRIDGTVPSPEHTVFVLPTRPASVRIASRAAAPQQLGTARDPRELGVAIRRIVIRQGKGFHIVEASDERLADGFHAYEPGTTARWTNGDAVLPPDLFNGFTAGVEVLVTTTGRTFYVDNGTDRRVA